MDNTIITISGLQKMYAEKPIFSGLDCTIERGEFVVLTGASGCGKTTLLYMIGGLEPVTAGSIIVNGLNVSHGKNLKKYYRDTVGFIFQNFALVEQKTVTENLNMVHAHSKTDISYKDALLSVGMEGTEKQKVYTLSGGEQQRIALARLRLKNCDLILADEPTGSLDRKNGEIVMNILHQLNNEGKTVIMATHDESLIQSNDRWIKL